MEASDAPVPLARSLVTGLFQLVMGLLALLWGLLAFPAWQQGESLRFWWGLALGLFCLGMAGINLVWPLITRLGERPPRGETLAVRLTPEFNRSDSLSIPLMGLAFALPALPLWFIFFSIPGDTPERFIAAGFGLVTSVLAVLLLVVGIRQAYVGISGQSFRVELEKEALLPGESARLYLRARRGRLPVERIEMHLVCRRRGAPDSDEALPVTLYEELLYAVPDAILGDDRWEKNLQISLPEDALPTYTSQAGPMLTWEIQLRVRLGGLPDYVEKYAFQVLPLEDDESEAGDELVPDEEFDPA